MTSNKSNKDSRKWCWPFFHKFKLVRAGAIGEQWKCARCGEVRFTGVLDG